MLEVWLRVKDDVKAKLRSRNYGITNKKINIKMYL